MKPLLDEAKARSALTHASLVKLNQFERILLSAIVRQNTSMSGNESSEVSIGALGWQADETPTLEQFLEHWSQVVRQRELVAKRKEKSNRTNVE